MLGSLLAFDAVARPWYGLQTLEDDRHSAGYADTKIAFLNAFQRLFNLAQPKSVVAMARVPGFFVTAITTRPSAASSEPDQRGYFLLRFLEGSPGSGDDVLADGALLMGSQLIVR